MNNKLKTIVGIVLFVVLIGAAYFGYTALTEDRKPNISEPNKPEADIDTDSPEESLLLILQ